MIEMLRIYSKWKDEGDVGSGRTRGTLVLKQLDIGGSFLKEAANGTHNIQHPPSSYNAGLRRTGRANLPAGRHGAQGMALIPLWSVKREAEGVKYQKTKSPFRSLKSF
jgi:hypothetical protein